MENATEAIYMAFAVLVFAIALTLSMTMFSRARATSDAILYNSDETNFLEYKDSTQYSNAGRNRNRIVGLETVIPTLYRYYKENYTVLFREANINDYDEAVANKTVQASDYRYLLLYRSDTEEDNWPKIEGTPDTQYSGKYYNASGDLKEVYSFDLDEETKRNEPWTSSVKEIKKNLDAFINGGEYYLPSSGTTNPVVYQDYGTGFKNDHSNDKFLEQIGEYTNADDRAYTGVNNAYDQSGGTSIEVDGEIISLLAQSKKRVIIYTLL